MLSEGCNRQGLVNILMLFMSTTALVKFVYYKFQFRKTSKSNQQNMPSNITAFEALLLRTFLLGSSYCPYLLYRKDSDVNYDLILKNFLEM